MANMSYCRFENTYSDLLDCYESLQNKSIDELSESENKYALRLIKLCSNITDDYLELRRKENE